MFHVLLICCSISKDKLVALCKWYKENGLVPRKKKSGGRTTRCLLIDDIRKVVAFISNYAENHAVRLPGRLASHFKSNVQLLPTSTTKSAIFRLYEDTQNKTGKALLFFLTQLLSKIRMVMHVQLH